MHPVKMGPFNLFNSKNLTYHHRHQYHIFQTFLRLLLILVLVDSFIIFNFVENPPPLFQYFVIALLNHLMKNHTLLTIITIIIMITQLIYYRFLENFIFS